METKKNPRADVRRNSSIYFAVGLVIMLLAANYLINYRTYDKVPIDLAALQLGELEEDAIPITEHPVTPPPETKPPVVPEVIEIALDDPEIIETAIGITDDNEEDPILEIPEIIVEEPKEEVEVPFISIENVPVFPGCEKGNNDKQRACMSQKISKHVQKKFDSDLASELGLFGKQRMLCLAYKSCFV